MHHIRWVWLLLLAILSSLLVAISRETRLVGIRGSDDIRQNRGPPCPAAAASTQDECHRRISTQKIGAVSAAKTDESDKEKEAFLKQCPGYGYGGRIDKLFAEQVAPR